MLLLEKLKPQTEPWAIAREISMLCAVAVWPRWAKTVAEWLGLHAHGFK